MRFTATALLILFIAACQPAPPAMESTPAATAVAGTWKLLTGILIQNGDTSVTDYTKGQSFIKIINNTHFAFLHHDLTKGKDSAAIYSSGGGTYMLKDTLYTEHLEYCTGRQWEGNTFEFTVTIKGDTLVQKGVEKIKDLHVDRLNIEKYVRAN